jgi:RNA polymerase primary sigma factor
VAAPRALAELARLHDAVSSGTVRARDVLRVRVTDHAPGAVLTNRTRLLEVLALAGRSGGGSAAEDLGLLGERIVALRLQPSVLERAAEAMVEPDREARLAFARARRASRLAKAEWTAMSAYLVLAIAKRYRRPGVDTVDLVQDGSIGLIRAVEKFDSSLGHPFHVYAAWWIRQHIFRALATYGRTIRVPLPMVEASYRVARARRVFEGVHGVEPDDAELASLSGIDLATVATVGKIADEPVTFFRAGSEDTSVLDHLADKSADLPDEQVARAHLNERVRMLYGELPSRERDVLRLRFGLDGGREHTHVEVAATLQVSRERARRIEEHALAKLRAWSARGGHRGAAA